MPVSPVPTPVSTPVASNTTSQTIVQVQTSPCASHCDGGTQIQQASQANTTVQATIPTPSPTAAPQTTITATHPTEVQVGCLEDCHGTTTLDTSGLTLGQIEQLLGQLELPPLPPLKAAPGALQNVTQQSSAQSEAGNSGTANQAQVADQSNATVQAAGAPAEESVGPVLVNQTGQGIWQLQLGCLFDCTGTVQVQQATQSNTTVQAPAGASALNAVTQLVWQLQIGCLFTCYDAVESQGASATDSTTVVPPAGPATPPPGDGSAVPGDPSGSAPASPGDPAPGPAIAPRGDSASAPLSPPAQTESLAAPSAPGTAMPVLGETRGSVVGAGLVIQQPAHIHPVLRVVVVRTGSVSATTLGGERLASLSASRSVVLQYSHPLARSAPRRRDHRRAALRAQAPSDMGGATARRAGVDATDDSMPWLGLVLAIAAVLALTAAVRRLRQSR